LASVLLPFCHKIESKGQSQLIHQLQFHHVLITPNSSEVVKYGNQEDTVQAVETRVSWRNIVDDPVEYVENVLMCLEVVQHGSQEDIVRKPVVTTNTWK